MDLLPEDIFKIIFDNILYNEPHKIYNLRRINKNFKFIIDDVENNYKDKYYNKTNISNIFNHLVYVNIDWNIKIFKWLFKNDIYLTFNNITNIIRYNRLDVLKESVKYKENSEILFDTEKYNILTFGDHRRLVIEKSPLIIAGKNNYVEIIDFLIENSNLKNPYIRQIDTLVDSMIDDNNVIMVKYMFDNYYDKIIGKKLTGLKVLKKLINCEDLILHLIEKNRVYINNDFIITSLYKNYINVCLICYDVFEGSILIPSEHVRLIMERANVKLLSKFITKYPIYFNHVLNFLRKSFTSKEVFMFIFNNYLKWIDVDYPIIEIYLNYDGNFRTIKQLVDYNYLVTKEAIVKSLEMPSKDVFYLLSKKY